MGPNQTQYRVALVAQHDSDTHLEFFEGWHCHLGTKAAVCGLLHLRKAFLKVSAAHVYRNTLDHAAPMQQLHGNYRRDSSEHPSCDLESAAAGSAAWLRKLDIVSPEPFVIDLKQ